MSFTFGHWHAATPDLPGWARAEAFRFLTDTEQEACWARLAEDAAHETELQRRDPLLYDEWPPPERHQPARSSTAAPSTRPGAVAFTRSGDDPLKNIEPRVYVEALTGAVVPESGWLNCPLPDHEDRTPSFQVLSTHWRCFGCGRGGTLIDLGAALYDLEPRGRGFRQLRERLVAELGLRGRA